MRSITVSGFRGIGAAATLELEPGPRLTLVVGRNGSGKSSFAEGLEVLLTGGLRRWQEAAAVAWRAGWRNLHAAGEVRLSADLLLEDAGQATVQRVWDTGTGLADSRADLQVIGEKRAGLSRLGWDDPLITYRPFLSHSELRRFCAAHRSCMTCCRRSSGWRISISLRNAWLRPARNGRTWSRRSTPTCPRYWTGSVPLMTSEPGRAATRYPASSATSRMPFR